MKSNPLPPVKSPSPKGLTWASHRAYFSTLNEQLSFATFGFIFLGGLGRKPVREGMNSPLI